ncbi:MAG: hypothetical protein ABI721_05645 [Candidatus Dojkabacteria bacterium]
MEAETSHFTPNLDWEINKGLPKDLAESFYRIFLFSIGPLNYPDKDLRAYSILDLEIDWDKDFKNLDFENIDKYKSMLESGFVKLFRKDLVNLLSIFNDENLDFIGRDEEKMLGRIIAGLLDKLKYFGSEDLSLIVKDIQSRYYKLVYYRNVA